jgi:hypothetical protein
MIPSWDDAWYGSRVGRSGTGEMAGDRPVDVVMECVAVAITEENASIGGMILGWDLSPQEGGHSRDSYNQSHIFCHLK